MFLRLHLSLAVLVILSTTLPTLGAQVAETVASPQEKAVQQLDVRQESEVTFEDAEEQDKEFDAEFDSKNSDSEAAAGPSQDTVQELLRSNADSEAPGDFSAEGATEAYSSSLRSSSYRSCWGTTWTNSNGCCRKSDNYGCRSTRQCMPCFWHYTYYFKRLDLTVASKEKRSVSPAVRLPSKQWCCPIWPQQYIYNCSCRKCFSLKTYGVQSGTCQRRYTRRTFFAACYSYGHWYGQFITKYLPSSCYCRLNPTSDC